MKAPAWKAIVAGEAAAALLAGVALGPVAWDYGSTQMSRLVAITTGETQGGEAQSGESQGGEAPGGEARGQEMPGGEARGGNPDLAVQPPAKLPAIGAQDGTVKPASDSTLRAIVAVAKARDLTRITSIGATGKDTSIDGIRGKQRISIGVESDQRISYHSLGPRDGDSIPLKSTKTVVALKIPRLIARARKDLKSKADFTTLDIRYDAQAKTDVLRVYLGQGTGSTSAVYRVKDMKKLYVYR